MAKKFSNLATKFLCGILSGVCVLSTQTSCLAATNTDKVNSLLQEIYAENPNYKNQEQIIKDEIYNRLKIARERNYSENIQCDYTLLNESSDKKDVFEKIYDSNFWGSNESKSGPGSQVGSTESLRESLPKIFEKYNIKTVLDAPCGDYNWMRTVDKTGITYIGGDIVPKIVRENNKNFKDQNTSFKVIDITTDKIPKVDLIICRDCLQHLSHKNVKKALKNFKDSGSKYLLVTNYPWTLENYDIKNGDFNPLNLLEKPFNLPVCYVDKIKEAPEEGNCVDKYLYLYKLEDINTEQMLTKEVAPSNIPVAMALDENYVYPTVVSITSAMENSSYRSKYDFYIMHTPDLSDESKKILLSLQEKYDNCSINLIDMKNSFKSAYTDSRISTPAYYRLALSDIIPNFDKIIWVDGDTVIFKDLSEMINVDMDGYCYKGFLDFPRVEQLEPFGVYSDHYICDGVMVVNLEELRKESAVQKFEDFIANNNDKLEQHDQTVINAVFADKIGVLPAKFGIWNMSIEWFEFFQKLPISPESYTIGELINANYNPSVLHCVCKPWKFPREVFATEKWWKYAEKTDIFDKIKEKYLISDGIYTIASAIDNNKVLDIAGGSTDCGTKLQLWDKNNSNAQKFKVTYDKDGYYVIESLCSGKVIDVPGSSCGEHTQLWQYDNNNSDAQKWYITPNGDGSYRIVSKCNGLNVDILGADTQNGTPVQCFHANGTTAQNFIFINAN